MPSPHARYTKYWTTKSPLYRKLALALQIIQYTELLWEMAARRRGEKVRWRIIALIEFAKAVCRLALLRLTNSRPLVNPPLPERETDPRAAEAEKEAAAGDWNGMDEPIEDGDASSSSSSSDLSWTMPRTGLTLPSLPDANEISNYLISKVLTADDVKAPATLLHRVSGQGQFAEILYILRPVIYALAMQRWSKNKKSWSPWLIGFGLEYGSRQLAKRDLAERAAGGLRGLTGLEREELKKRGWAMGWWMMRGAFYENITRFVLPPPKSCCSFLSLTFFVRPWIAGIADKLKGKPLLDIAGGLLDDYEYLWDKYYFSTASL